MARMEEKLTKKGSLKINKLLFATKNVSTLSICNISGHMISY